MVNDILKALFLDRCSKRFRVGKSPAMRRLDREKDAEHEAFLLALHDSNQELWNAAFPTYRHHIDQARARRSL